jgi:hypothetical protein
VVDPPPPPQDVVERPNARLAARTGSVDQIRFDMIRGSGPGAGSSPSAGG